MKNRKIFLLSLVVLLLGCSKNQTSQQIKTDEELKDNYTVLPGKGFSCGNYPQSVVTDKLLNVQLYTYFIQNIQTIKSSSFYYDGDNDGVEEKYVAVRSSNYTDADGTHIEIGYRFYKYEPVVWLSIGENRYISEKILDKCSFGGNSEGYIDENNNYKYVHNQYEISYVREYLNTRFINEIFTKETQEKNIRSTLNKNDEKTYGNKTFYRDTIDEMFLISKEEYNQDSFSNFRKAEVTDYYKDRNSYERDETDGKDYGEYLTRSHYETNGELIYFANSKGKLSVDNYYSVYGIRPVITFVA